MNHCSIQPNRNQATRMTSICYRHLQCSHVNSKNQDDSKKIPGLKILISIVQLSIRHALSLETARWSVKPFKKIYRLMLQHATWIHNELVQCVVQSNVHVAWKLEPFGSLRGCFIPRLQLYRMIGWNLAAHIDLIGFFCNSQVMSTPQGCARKQLKYTNMTENSSTRDVAKVMTR